MCWRENEQVKFLARFRWYLEEISDTKCDLSKIIICKLIALSVKKTSSSCLSLISSQKKIYFLKRQSSLRQITRVMFLDS